MKNVFKSSLLTLFLTLLLLSVASNVKSVNADPTIRYVPTEYATIQAAVNASNDGDTVYVYNGTYHEWKINVTKSICLVGQSKTTTIIEGDPETGPIIKIEASNVNISGFTIQESKTGIYLYYSNSSSVNDNIIITNVIGGGGGYIGSSTGILLDCSYRNTICENYLKNNFNGIKLSHSHNNTIVNNVVTSNCSET